MTSNVGSRAAVQRAVQVGYSTSSKTVVEQAAPQIEYRKALEQTDFKDYREQLREFDRLVSDDAASAWLYTGKDYVAAQNDVQGVDANLAGSRLALAQLS